MVKPKVQPKKGNTDTLMQYAEQIITKMKNETELFPSPVPPLTELEAALAACRLASTDAAFRDIRAIKIRNEKEAELRYQIAELSKYVDTIAKGNSAVILSAGFAPSAIADSSGSQPAPKPQRLEAIVGELGSGRMHLRTTAWAKARLYLFEYRKKGTDTPWTAVMSSKSTVTLQGLEVFAEYEFRVAYLGIDPTVTYSDIVSSYVI